MANQLFQRRCRVFLIQDDGRRFTFDGFRVQFKIEKSLRKEPNTADVRVTNLGRQTRASLQQMGGRLILEAGYSSLLGQVFAGDIRTTDHTFTRPDWDTHIQCGDGERAFAFATINNSFAPGTPLADLIGAIGGAMSGKKLDTDKFVRAAKGLPGAVANGFSAYGKASTELDRVLAGTGYEWSIQDCQLQLLREGGALSEVAVLLSPETGLIGSPEHGTPDKKHKPSVMKAKALLQPRFAPGRAVRIESLHVNGDFVVQKVTHTGDTAGGDWYSEIEALPLAA